MSPPQRGRWSPGWPPGAVRRHPQPVPVTDPEVVVVSTPPVPPRREDRDRGADVEPDPTGIRALLGALPDPGPMPEDLVARIQASIAAEQAARDDSTVVPLRPRRGW